MKPGIYATKKATAPITIAMVRMIRSSLSSGNMTQDRGISFELPWPFVPLRECPFGTIITGFPTDAVPNIKHSSELRISWIDRGKRHSDYLHWD